MTLFQPASQASCLGPRGTLQDLTQLLSSPGLAADSLFGRRYADNMVDWVLRLIAQTRQWQSFCDFQTDRPDYGRAERLAHEAATLSSDGGLQSALNTL